MAAAALVVTNLVDSTATVLSASAAVAGSPASNLREEHIARKWRDNNASTFVLADLGSAQLVDTVALLGLSSNIPITGTPFTFRYRLSSVDATGAAGDVLDTGTISGTQYFDPNYSVFGYLDTIARSARYVRIDIAQLSVSPDISASYIEAGRWVIGDRQAFGTNFQAPWSRGPKRNSADTFGVGGQTFVDRRPGYWTINAQFNFITEAERTALIETIGIAIVNSGHKDFLWINDGASLLNARDLVWGYIDGDLRLTQSIYLVPALYGVTFPIRQRL